MKPLFSGVLVLFFLTAVSGVCPADPPASRGVGPASGKTNSGTGSPQPVQTESGKAVDGAKLPLPKGVTEESAAGKPGNPPASGDDSAVKGSFSEVSGLEIEVDPVDYRTGPEDTVMPKTPGIRKHPDIKVKSQPLKDIGMNKFGDSVIEDGGPEIKKVQGTDISFAAGHAAEGEISGAHGEHD